MATFTVVGDTVELFVPARGEAIEIDISGTYDMTIVLQREQGSRDSGAWETLRTYITANATVSETYMSAHDNENLRLIVTVDTSGTATATLADNTDRVVREWKDQAGNAVITLRQSGLTVPGTLVAENVSIVKNFIFTGPTITIAVNKFLKAGGDANKVLFTNVATNLVITLPAATGTGNVYKLVTGTTVTANHTYQVANAVDTFIGFSHMNVTTVDTEVFQALATTDTITLNGSTTGGLFGSVVKFTDVAAGKWLVEAELNCSGIQVTPFSAEI